MLNDFSDTGFYYITGKIGSFVSFLLARIERRRVIVFYENDDEAFLAEEEIAFYTKKPVHLFPIYTHRVFEKEDEAKRTAFLHHLASDDQFIGLFPYDAVAHHLSTSHAIESHAKWITRDATLFQEDLIEYLDKAGYEAAPLVREVGEYGKRGSIVDMFAPSYEQPLRIEFFGDQVLSIRFFDPMSQRSLKEINDCSLTEIKQTQTDSATTIIDYLDKETVLVHEGMPSLNSRLAGSDSALLRERWEHFCHTVLNIVTSGIQDEEDGITICATSNDDLRLLFNEHKTEIFAVLSEKLKNEWSAHKYVYVFTGTEHQAKRLQEIFDNYGVSFSLLSEISAPEREWEWGIITGPIRRGFRTDDMIVITEDDIVGIKKRPVKRKWGVADEFLTSFKDLVIDDWVVHVDHGIGVYKGIFPLRINGSTKDFLLIEYQEGDKLYVPVDDLHLVQKFIGAEKFKPKIDRLGSSLWKNTKKRVKKQIEDIAGELLDIYAARQLAEGFSYSPVDELFREMESSFAFEETDGQLKAIEEVLGDLQSPRPMDRLVCGDVGFGKTEVAIRASFKVVLDNKQVSILVPTTVLAQQHYKTFSDRLAAYSVNVGVLSRFKTKEEQRATLEEVKSGGMDIIIGTHRLLQKDIAFRDLGLIIIDEEQRFGVRHKEKLKQFRKNVDVLTLSATPIPRTLYMATMGIKDLSIIDSPPLDRMAVRTHVVQFNDKIVRKGILDELRRNGQVFFVHNYVHNIGAVFEHLSKLLPGVRIAVAHGQMDGKKLEKIMLDFINKEYDVLLSTNIIESGLDISNVNTIFINNAHRMGLSDLYQLRGRVGRSEKQAYAYLLVSQHESLSRDAKLRLKIIEEMTELGSGFQIANYDLEIRGAGNLLGREQSGNINLIGFELYCTMLEEAMEHLKHKTEKEEEQFVTEINLPVDAFIPDDYMPDSGQRLLMYKRLSRARNDNELDGLREEFIDRFGAIPGPLNYLFEIISLKSFLSRLRVKKIESTGNQVVIHITPQTPLDMKALLQKATVSQNMLKLMPDGRILLKTDKKLEELMRLIRNLLMEISIL